MSAGLISFLIAAWWVVSLSSPAAAYLDPVTGSFLIQGVIASVVAVLAAIRTVRERVLGLFGIRRTEPAPTETSKHVDDAAKPAAHDAPRS